MVLLIEDFGQNWGWIKDILTSSPLDCGFEMVNG